MVEPRLLTKATRRQLLGGIAWSEVCIRMERGQIPFPLWNVAPDDKAARWDRRSVDRALDRASSIQIALRPTLQNWIAPLASDDEKPLGAD